MFITDKLSYTEPLLKGNEYLLYDKIYNMHNVVSIEIPEQRESKQFNEECHFVFCL